MGSASVLAGIGEIGQYAGIDILNPLPTDWQILPDDGSALTPDTVTKFEFRGEYRTSDYPMEQGAFASYNKVAEPFQIRMQMVFSGLNLTGNSAIDGVLNVLGTLSSQSYQKGDALTQLQALLSTPALCSVVTPDVMYQSVTLDHYDYKRESNNGASLLIVEAWFREVRQTADASYTNSNSPSAADPVGAGTVQPITPASSIPTYPLGANPANIGPFQ